MRCLRWSGLALACALGCATAAVTEAPPDPARAHRPPRAVMPDVELFFRGDQPFARRGEEEWSIGDVSKGEMIFSPDRRKFAYVRRRGEGHAAHVLVRNLAGDPINEFAVYRPGDPDDLIWLDNHRIGYVAPPDRVRPAARVYVVHDVDTGEILSARGTAELEYGPERRHVAFVTGAIGRQNVVVDGRNVWPRRGVTHIFGAPAWSPDGHGIAFVESGAHGARLVVLVEFDNPTGDLTWNVPDDALAPGLKVFWAGDSKVLIGESALHPRFAADWKRLE